MKRIGYLYEKVIDVENCKKAILRASKGKKSRECVQKILSNIDYYANDLSERLQNGDIVSKYSKRTISDGLSKKERELLIPKFYPDQCAHHAIMNILMPIVIKSSYHWSCANFEGRGMDAASKHITRTTMKKTNKTLYCLKGDVRKFFPSVRHDVLKQKLEHKIKDKRFLNLLSIIIDSVVNSNENDVVRGIPIGNYTSPAFAEFMLMKLDHTILDDKCVISYTRYADDIVVISDNKEGLHKLLKKIVVVLEESGLELKGNYQIFPIMKNGYGRKIDFVGKCFAMGYTTVRKRRALAFMRQSRYIRKHRFISYKTASGFMSRCNMFRYTNSYYLKEKYFNGIKMKPIKEAIRSGTYRMALIREQSLSCAC